MPQLEITDRELLNTIQSDFPLVDEPYAEIGNRLGINEGEVLERVRILRKSNIVRQISAIFDTRRLGYKTTLVAMAYEPGNLHRSALKINKHPGVSHNYAREGSFYNLWFTLAVPPNENLEDAVHRLTEETGALATRLMPTIRFFKIGVNFDMVKEEGAAYKYYSPDGYGDSKQMEWNKAIPLTEFDVEAIRVLQEDLPQVSRPFDSMASYLGVTTQQLFSIAKEFQKRGIMRRYSAILHHRRAGFSANAMAVWKVPEVRAEEVGKSMASHPAVTQCYQRPTFPDWHYTHFTMIHATTKDGCEQVVQKISLQTGITEYTLLYSTREYKKTRVRYFV